MYFGAPRSSSAGSRSSTPPPATTKELRDKPQSRLRSSSSDKSLHPLLDLAATQKPRAVPLFESLAGVAEPNGTISASSSRRPSPSPRIATGSQQATSSLVSSRNNSPSRDQFKKLVKATYFGFASEYPNDTDLSRHQRSVTQRPPRLTEAPLDPKFHNYRGHVKCKHCAAMVPFPEVDEHYKSACPLAPVHCPLVDSETGTPCGSTFRGRQALHEHLVVCPLRTRRCENRGCGKQVSVCSVALHSRSCHFEPVRCATCHVVHDRGENQNHASVCPMEDVDCPLGCGVSMKRSEVAAHIDQTAHLHKPNVLDPRLRAPEDPHSVMHQLLQRIVDMHQAAQRKFGGASVVSQPASRSSTPMVVTSENAGRPNRTAPSSTFPATAGYSDLHIRRQPQQATCVTDEPPSTIHGDGDDDPATHDEIDGDRHVNPSLQCSMDSFAGAEGSHSTHHPSSLLKQLLLTRPTLRQPASSISFSRLQEHLTEELTCMHRALDEAVGEIKRTISTSAAENSAEALTALLQDVDTRLQHLHQLVGAFSTRTLFDPLSKKEGEAAQEVIQALWKSCDRVWYEWKLVMYERMYLS